MKLTIRNLQNETFDVDCDKDDTVKQLKEKIAAKKDAPQKYDPELLKLLCLGKVMDDEDTVDSFSIKPESFLVLVKQTPGKPKPPPKKKPQFGFNNSMGGFGSGSGLMMQNPFGGPNSLGGMGGFGGPNAFGSMGGAGGSNAFGNMGTYGGAAGFGGTGGFSGPGAQGGATGFGGAGGYSAPSAHGGAGSLGQPTHFPAPAAAADDLEDASADAFATPKEREEAIETLVAIGFDKSQADKALRASFYNVEVAANYLATGRIPNVGSQSTSSSVPATSKPPVSAALPSSPPSLPPAPTQQQAGTGGGSVGNLQEMRQMLQQHPEQLQMIRQRLQTEHPELAQLIGNDPQQFLQLLEQASSMSIGGSTPSPSVPVAPARITLTDAEQQKIDRLQELGFERNRATEAFLACGRDENAAANYLFSLAD